MLIKKTIGGIYLEWIEEKNAVNLRKHGLDFETAAYVFADENRIEYVDVNHSGHELRYATIGLVSDVIFVVYCERGKYIHMISARAATKAEIKAYQKGGWT